MARTIMVELVGDSRSLERAFARSERAGKQFNRGMENASRGALAATVGFRGLGRAVGFASASFLGAAGFVTAVKAGFNELFQSQAVAADTAAALKSTGQVAGVTAKEINTLASSLQRLTGYDDEAIQSAENLILTFTNVRNVVGKGNDIFDQATKATLDLSRRFDQDLSTSAVQLGKALQDPIRGVTALRRAGVSFSTAQQKLINRLVSTGRVLEAQKIILQEVRTEVGGAAEAFGKTTAGQVEILKGNVENLAGSLAELLNPELQKAVGHLNKWLENPANKKSAQDTIEKGVHGIGVAFKFTGDMIGRAIDLGKKFNDAKVTKYGIFGGGGGGGGGGDFGPRVQSALGLLAPGAATPPWMLSGPDLPAYPPGVGPGRRGGAKPPGTDAAERARLARLARERRARMTTMRNTWFDAAIGRQLTNVQDISTIKGQIARLKEISGLITARIAVTNDITRQLNLEDQAKDVGRRRRGLEEDLKVQAQQAKDAAKAAREAAIETKMGWLAFAVERADATKTIKDNVKAQQNIISYLQTRMRQEGRTLEIVSGIWRARQEIIDLNKKQSNVDPLAGLMQVSSKRLTAILAAGTGLTGAGRRVLGANIAGAEIQPLHVHVNIDGREVGRAVTNDQARTGRRTARQTSGQRG